MKLRLEVGQPKGFDSGDKTNIIIGTVEDALCGSRVVEAMPNAATLLQAQEGDKKTTELTEYWIVVSCKPFDMDGIKVSSILFIPRYKAKKSPVDFFEDGEQLVMHGVWRTDGAPWDNASIQAAHDGTIDIAGMLVVSAKKFKE